jgi:hypothetical protein
VLEAKLSAFSKDSALFKVRYGSGSDLIQHCVLTCRKAHEAVDEEDEESLIDNEQD